MTNMIEVCSNFRRARVSIIDTCPNQIANLFTLTHLDISVNKVKSSFVITLMCATRRQIPVGASANPETGNYDLISFGDPRVDHQPLHPHPPRHLRQQGQILFFNCLDLRHKLPDSGELQCKSETSKRRFDPWIDHKLLHPHPPRHLRQQGPIWFRRVFMINSRLVYLFNKLAPGDAFQ